MPWKEAGKRVEYLQSDSHFFSKCKKIGKVSASHMEGDFFGSPGSIIGTMRERAAKLGGTGINIRRIEKNFLGHPTYFADVYK